MVFLCVCLGGGGGAWEVSGHQNSPLYTPLTITRHAGHTYIYTTNMAFIYVLYEQMLAVKETCSNCIFQFYGIVKIYFA